MISLVIFLLGLAIGSFLNVLIYRLPHGEDFVQARSRCPFCRHNLAWYDLVPLLSFVFLKGKCRYCHQRISWRYFGVELLTGLIFVWLWPAWFWLVVASLLIVLIFIDFDHFLIPDKIIIVLAVLALLYQMVRPNGLSNHLFSALVSGLVFLVIFLVTKGKKMGLGDVKLMALLGLIFAFPSILIVFYLGVAGALVWGIILVLFFQGRMQTKLPFGSFLAGAALVFILFSQFLLSFFNNYFFRLYL